MNLSTEQYAKVRDAIGGYVTGCPEPAIRSAIDLAVSEYVRDIGGIQIDIPVVVCGNGFARLSAPFGGVVINIRRINSTQGPIDMNHLAVRKDGEGGIVVYLGSYCGCATVATVEWKPGVDTDEMPESWFSANFDGIRSGSITRLLSQTTKPWADAALAVQFSDEYKGAVHDALYDLHAGRDGRVSIFDRNSTFL